MEKMLKIRGLVNVSPSAGKIILHYGGVIGNPQSYPNGNSGAKWVIVPESVAHRLKVSWGNAHCSTIIKEQNEPVKFPGDWKPLKKD